MTARTREFCQKRFGSNSPTAKTRLRSVPASDRNVTEGMREGAMRFLSGPALYLRYAPTEPLTGRRIRVTIV